MRILVDKKLLDENVSNESGGWTKAQLNVLGIDWPPYKGWKDDVINKNIYLNEDELDLLNKQSKQLNLLGI
jgi:hypothetical protein